MLVIGINSSNCHSFALSFTSATSLASCNTDINVIMKVVVNGTQLPNWRLVAAVKTVPNDANDICEKAGIK